MDSTLKSPVVLSLCTGSRGLERGIERAIGRDLRTAAYVEIEAFVIENLVGQMEQGLLAPAPVWSNLKTFPSEQFHRKIHGITGGYPCQPFSVAGKRGGKEDPRHLWPHIKRMVGTIRPVWCFFENVPGHLTLGYREVRSDLEQLGYTVKEGIFSAEEVGAPHQRKRLFILAVDNSCSKRFEQEYKISTRGNSPEPTGEMADSESIRQQGQCIDVREVERTKDQTEEWSWADGIHAENRQLADSNILRPQHRYIARVRRIRESVSWPAPPGQEQFEWESERTLKSRMGFRINGYNFREDLLRMAGNAVVEQTAEIAWLTLWDKIKLRNGSRSE